MELAEQISQADIEPAKPLGDVNWWRQAAVKLAASILSGRGADDSEPITHEWLLSIGFVHPDRSAPLLLELGKLETRPEFKDGSGKRYWTYWRSKTQAQSVWPEFEPKTRGDARRLCAALGIELNREGK